MAYLRFPSRIQLLSQEGKAPLPLVRFPPVAAMATFFLISAFLCLHMSVEPGLAVRRRSTAAGLMPYSSSSSPPSQTAHQQLDEDSASVSDGKESSGVESDESFSFSDLETNSNEEAGDKDSDAEEEEKEQETENEAALGKTHENSILSSSFFQRGRAFTLGGSRRGGRRSQSAARARPFSSVIYEEEAEQAIPPGASAPPPASGSDDVPVSSGSLWNLSRRSRLSAPASSASRSRLLSTSSPTLPSAPSSSSSSECSGSGNEETPEEPGDAELASLPAPTRLTVRRMRASFQHLQSLVSELHGLHNAARTLLGEYRYHRASLPARRTSWNEADENVQAMRLLQEQAKAKRDDATEKATAIRCAMRRLSQDMNAVRGGFLPPSAVGGGAGLPFLDSLIRARVAIRHAHGSLEQHRAFEKEFCSTFPTLPQCLQTE